MKYATARAMDRLNKELSLGARGDEQGWDLELADADRLPEFLAIFNRGPREAERDFAFVELLVASLEALVNGRLYQFDGSHTDHFIKNGFEIQAIYTTEELAHWAKIRDILISDLTLYREIIRYWACLGDFMDGEPFSLTPLFHDLILSILGRGPNLATVGSS